MRTGRGRGRAEAQLGLVARPPRTPEGDLLFHRPADGRVGIGTFSHIAEDLRAEPARHGLARSPPQERHELATAHRLPRAEETVFAASGDPSIERPRQRRPIPRIRRNVAEHCHVRQLVGPLL